MYASCQGRISHLRPSLSGSNRPNLIAIERVLPNAHVLRAGPDGLVRDFIRAPVGRQPAHFPVRLVVLLRPNRLSKDVLLADPIDRGDRARGSGRDDVAGAADYFRAEIFVFVLFDQAKQRSQGQLAVGGQILAPRSQPEFDIHRQHQERNRVRIQRAAQSANQHRQHRRSLSRAEHERPLQSDVSADRLGQAPQNRQNKEPRLARVAPKQNQRPARASVEAQRVEGAQRGACDIQPGECGTRAADQQVGTPFQAVFRRPIVLLAGHGAGRRALGEFRGLRAKATGQDLALIRGGRTDHARYVP